MARCSRISPIPISMELQNAMNITPELFKRDPRRAEAWNHVTGSPLPAKPFPQGYRHTTASEPSAYPHFVATPTSPESLITPAKSQITLRPTKLTLSPASNDPSPPDYQNQVYGLMYPSREALREAPRTINNIDVIYQSPILQENIHHLLADHALDDKKSCQTLRYLGISE